MGEQQLCEALSRFVTVRNSTIQLLAGLTDEQANYTPGPGRWSVAQNADHLLLTEALYREQMKRLLELARTGERHNIHIRMEDFDLRLPLLSHRWMLFLDTPLTVLNRFLPSAVRETLLRVPVVKARNPTVSEPAPFQPIEALRAQLTDALMQTEALFAGEIPAGIRRVTVSHPLFGRNTIPGVLRMMTAHEERHGSQIRKVLRGEDWPPACNTMYMRNTAMIDKERGPREGLCPRCGADAEWSFANDEQTVVEVVCPDCGHFELPRAEFDKEEADIATPDQQE